MAPSEVANRILQYLQLHGLSEAEFSRMTKVPQSTLHRSLHRCKRLTATHRRLCRYAGIALDVHTASADMGKQLTGAILQIWDGSEEHGAALLDLLQTVSRLATAVDYRVPSLPPARCESG